MDERIDGEGGWWCCSGCGSLAGLTMPEDICVYCGGTEANFYEDGEFK